MINIEFFRSVKYRNTHNKQSLERILRWMTTNEVLKQNTMKYRQWLMDNPIATVSEKSEKKVYYFPAVIFAGTFSGTGKAEDINQISGLFVVDFDHIDNIIEVRRRLENDMHTYLLFASPSGDGLKLVVKHDLIDSQKWLNLFLEIQLYYHENYNLEIDHKCKDISRMCFIPYVDKLYRNDNSRIWHYSGVYEKQRAAHAMKSIDDLNPNETDALYHECYYISAYLFEHKINITEDYNDWLSYGFSLCYLGESGREIFHNISCISDKYDHDECDEKFDYMLENYNPDRTNICVFINNSKTAIANYHLFEKYAFNC
jgi:hypothetical protein